jgi:branched-chain amino acid transport system substrate-binding protein
MTVLGVTKVIFNSLHRLALATLIASVTTLLAAAAFAADPIRIGFGMPLTGSLASAGKAALLAYQMWAEEVNGRGGLLGRPIEFVFYDDQSNPNTVPAIYTKLLDVDKVDLVISGYATSQQAAAMPLITQRGMLFLCIFGTAVNAPYKYDRFFQMTPAGPDPIDAPSGGYFEVAMTIDPKPKTVALVGADSEFSKNSLDGARKNAEKHGLKIVYDRTYPPTLVDFTSIVRSIQATNPDVVFAASYPTDSVGLVRSAHELDLRTVMFGGAMIGLQYAPFKQQLGSLLNGVVDYDLWVPEPTMRFPGVDSFLQKYQARAEKAGVDPLGFFLPPFAYAEMQILEQALKTVGTIEQAGLANYIHGTEFETIVGKIKFGPFGEWEKARIIFVQYRGVSGNDISQFKEPGKQVIVTPKEFKSGDLEYPFSKINRQ